MTHDHLTLRLNTTEQQIITQAAIFFKQAFPKDVHFLSDY